MLLLVLSTLWCVVMSTANVPYLELFPGPVPLLSHGQFYDEHSCKQPASTLQITQFDTAEASSPFFPSVLPLNEKTQHIDNVCYSYFETGGTTLLFYASIVFKDGSSEQWSYSKDDVPGRLGTLRGGNPTCLFQEFAIKEACQNSFIVYRCFPYGCYTQLDAVQTPGVDVLLAVSTEANVTDECQNEHVAMLEGAGYNDRGYVKLPKNLPYQCVTSLKGAPSIGAEKVSPENSISKP